MIDLSHGEFRALVAKAFRGAGYSWGLTEEAAFAAGYLAEAGLPAADSVMRLLTSIDGRSPSAGMPNVDWEGNGGPLCPICVGSSLADRGRCDQLLVGPTAELLLVAPFLGAGLAGPNAAADGEEHLGYTMTWAGGRCEVAGTGLAISGAVPTTAVAFSISRGPVQLDREAPVRRVLLSAEHLDRLERFAHRVYAPATEASRAGGAGAGTTDND